MKKLLILFVLAGIFIFGAVTVQAHLDSCGIAKHAVRKDSSYTYSDGNIWYNASGDGSTLFYEHDYLLDEFNQPYTIRWGNNGYIHFMFSLGHTAYGNMLCWQEAIIPYSKVTGEHCLWSDTRATRKVSTGVIALYGGANPDTDVRVNSAKSI